MKSNDLLIVGLDKGDSGRSCASHAVCGQSVEVGNLLHFDSFNNGSEYHILKEGCRVGYLKMDVAKTHPAHYFSDRLAEVMELHSESPHKCICAHSYAFHGMARIELYPPSFCKSLK